ncbi:hypothetical protein [Kingella potus]
MADFRRPANDGERVRRLWATHPTFDSWESEYKTGRLKIGYWLSKTAWQISDGLQTMGVRASPLGDTPYF